MVTTALPLTQSRQVVYPESDGKPMAETDVHRDLMLDLIATLQEFYREASDVYVSGNLLIYYVEGDPKRHIAPDVFVVKGIAKHRRNIYQTWVEGKAPNVVIELTSKSTRREDTHTKRALYEKLLRVPEYFLFDPTGDYLRPTLQGYRLVFGRYKRLALIEGVLRSEQLGMILKAEDEQLSLHLLETGERLLTPAEQAEALRIAESALQHEMDARCQAEMEVERLLAELAVLKTPQRETSGATLE